MKVIALLIASVFSANAACVNYTFIDFEGGTNGTQISDSGLSNSLHGNLGLWTLSNPSTRMSFTNYAQQALVGGTFNLCVGGTVTGAGTLGIAIMGNEADNQTITFYPTNWGGVSAVNTNCRIASYGAWVTSDMLPAPPDATHGQHDLLLLKADRPAFDVGGDYVNMFIDNRNDGTPANVSFFGLESEHRHDLTEIALFTNANWFWVTAQMHVGESNRLSIYDSSMHFQGTISGTNSGESFPHYIQWRYQNSELGTHVWWDSMIVVADGSDVFPVLPETAPNVPRTPRIRGIR